MLAKLAWRNLWRNKRRTLITLFSIAFGMLLAGSFVGISDDSYTRLIDKAAQFGNGHITVEPVGYRDTPTLDKTVTDTGRIMEQVKNLEGVVHATTRISGQALLATASDSVGAAFVAIDPAIETPESMLLLGKMADGKMFPKSTSKKIIIGSKLMDKLDVHIGNKIVITLTDKHGEISSSLVRVSGTFESGVDEVDGYFCILPLDTMRKVLDYQPGESTQVAILLEDSRKTYKYHDLVEKTLARSDVSVQTWHKTNAVMAGTVAMDKSGNYLFQIIIILLVAAGILNTMLMSVMERIREFGILVAIGMTPGRLFRMVLWEAVWLGIVGLVTGFILLTPVAWHLMTSGVDFSAMMGGETMAVGNVLFDPIIYFRIFPGSVVYLVTLVFGLTILAGLYPAWKAGKVVPVESIKEI